jgi:hypothetical protein
LPSPWYQGSQALRDVVGAPAPGSFTSTEGKNPCATCNGRQPNHLLLIRRNLLVEKLLHRLKQLHAIFFHDDRVRALANFHVALVGHIGELREIRVQHVAG